MDVAEFLIQRGINLNTRDNRGLSASLLYAECGTKSELIEFFMNGGSLEEFTNRGESSLELALIYNVNSDVFEFLLHNCCLSPFNEKYLRGAKEQLFKNFKFTYSYQIQQPEFNISTCSIKPSLILIMSIVFKKFDYFLYVISKVDVNEVDSNGRGVLALCIIYSRMDMFYYLIEKCPNLNLLFRSKVENYLPIDFAIKKGNEEIMMKLCEIHQNIYPLDSNFFVCSRIHQDLWFLLGRWKLYKSVKSCSDIHFKFQ
jgi:ankyrin repeat protein